MQQVACDGLDITDVRFYEGVTKPRHAQYAHAGAHAGFKGAGVQHFAGVDFAGDANQRCDGQHEHHNRFVTRQNRVLNEAYRVADGGRVEHDGDDTNQEQQYGAFCVRLQPEDLATAQAHFAFCQTLLVNRIVFQFGTEKVAQHGGDHYRNQRHRNANCQQRQVAHAHRLKNTREEDHGRGNRRRGDCNLGCHHGNRKRAGRANTLLFRHFGDHRQRGEGGVASTGENGHKPGHQRGKEGNVFRMATQHTLRQAHQVVHTASDLHGRDSGNNRHDDFDNVKWDGAGFNLKDKGKYEHTETAGKTDADTPESCSQINRQQDDDEFCSKHKDLPCSLTS